ncbi:uncharacterized protein LAESUDRAFT_720423 [Laetiporus sulphureus 93-53]|uniref:Protein OS-9 homolog n=1 Tax=Laetiporus sulphureus 93-53 TaxID=1314785 RepID=A0A165H4B6_9APHY|nr:uncharacterized protein LAESUDRAFT_720423 [Laetiporus sulphureus 93-53]KZT11225.1 hypothetical protein LAESUDRAFT_720423 [Laetiporus sulphureus 93-53]
MRPHPTALCLVPLSICLFVEARLHHSLVPEDPYASPKYRVTYLNGQPVLNETAQRWLLEGLQGGELEFLGQPWKDAQMKQPPLKSIEGGSEQETVSAPALASSYASNYTLEQIKLGPKMSYLCLIPPPSEENNPNISDDSTTDTTPAHSWSLLQPLTGTCLYHKQGWFTYSYCHNSHVRQFHELPHQHPHRLGEYKPQEDTEWEAYTLGRAPPQLEPGADLTVAEEAAVAANLELAKGAGSHYLVQRWGDGTYCEKTGQKREVEVQFHCSMTMTDTILFVKETQTCHYVLHIATPRLCGVPGFKSRHDSREETYIRCREILDAEEYEQADRALPPAGQPLKKPKRVKPVIAPPPLENSDVDGKPSGKTLGDPLRRALEQFLTRNHLKGGVAPEIVIEEFEDGDGDLVIEFVEADVMLDGEDEETITLAGESLADLLRAAGYDIKSGAEKSKKKTKEREDSDGAKDQRRDEL